MLEDRRKKKSSMGERGGIRNEEGTHDRDGGGKHFNPAGARGSTPEGGEESFWLRGRRKSLKRQESGRRMGPWMGLVSWGRYSPAGERESAELLGKGRGPTSEPCECRFCSTEGKIGERKNERKKEAAGGGGTQYKSVRGEAKEEGIASSKEKLRFRSPAK